MRISFIDFEASSLRPDSYPIEAGWSDGAGQVHSLLINVHQVDEWIDWDPAAESIHGLSRAQLERDGHPPARVAAALNEGLRGRSVYSDAADFDRHWNRRLFEAAGSACEFEILSIYSLYRQFDPDVIERAHREADARGFARTHRAAADVAHLQAVWEILNGY